MSVVELSVVLTSEQATAMKAAVDSGEYGTTDEIVLEAIGDWHEKRELRGEQAERLGTLWDEGKRSGAPQPFDIERTLASAKARMPGGA